MIAEFALSVLLLFSGKEQPSLSSPAASVPETDSVAWIELAEVNEIVEKNIRKNKIKEDKLIIVDFYTDWCGWCKRLDNETYRDAEVVALMNTYFYPVKFDAELRDSVVFANKTYGFKPAGSRGTNEFAIAMASRPGGKIGYPTISIISPLGEKIVVEAGFKDAKKMKLFLLYYGEGHYLTKDFTTFQTEYNQKQLTD